jgi:hypothetical protein
LRRELVDNDLVSGITPRPELNEYAREDYAKMYGGQVVICYGGTEGLEVAKFLRRYNPYSHINFIVAPTSLPFGESAPKDGILDKEIKQSHCIVVLLDINGFLESEKAKEEFKIILEHNEDKYIPIFLEKNEKDRIIKKVKEEFGVDLSQRIYAIWEPSWEFIDKLYYDIKGKVNRHIL